MPSVDMLVTFEIENGGAITSGTCSKCGTLILKIIGDREYRLSPNKLPKGECGCE